LTKQLTGKGKANSDLVRVFKQHLEQQFPVDGDQAPVQLRKPSDFARVLQVHVNHLNRALTAVTGKTTTEVLNERFVLEAKRLLWETDWKIANISWSLGFREANNFSAFFKRHTGVPPTVFRDRQKKAK